MQFVISMEIPCWLIDGRLRGAAPSINARDGALDYAEELCTLLIVSVFPQSLLCFFYGKPGAIPIGLLRIAEATHLAEVGADHERFRH
jgi:hypothetical protein